MERKRFVHRGQDEAFLEYRDGVSFQTDIEKIYETNEYLMRQPDLLGKTVAVNERQFDSVFGIVSELAKEASIDRPEVYVYEEFYYGAESYGINKPWIEISAKTIQDFSEKELRFVLGREIYKIADGVTKQNTIMEMYLKGVGNVAISEIEMASRLAYYHWYRLANYAADNYGFYSCKSVKASIDAILKMVLNSVPLANQINVHEFIGQAAKINRLDDSVSNYTKADEPMPYAPHRIQNILAFAVNI